MSALYDILSKDDKDQRKKAVNEAIQKELKRIYESTAGKFFPSMFGKLPLAILGEAINDDKFWDEHFFNGLTNYLRSEKEAIENILNLFDSSVGSELINLIKPDLTENWLKQIFTGMISADDKNEFFESPIQFIRDWVNLAEDTNNIRGLSAEDTKKRLRDSAKVVGLTLILLLLLIVVNTSRGITLNVGMTIRTLVNNVFKNTVSNKEISNLYSSTIKLIQSFINQKKKEDIAKNIFLVLKEIIKVINLLKDDPKTFENEIKKFPKDYLDKLKSIAGKIIKNGGLWEGQSMDYIIADLIYARVDVTYKGSQAIFKKRDNSSIIDWNNEESRKKHPLSKSVIKNSAYTNDELKSDSIHMILSEILKDINLPNVNTNSRTVNTIMNGMFKRASKDSKKEILNKLNAKKLVSKEDKELELYKKQIKSIINNFTFKHFYEIFNVDYVCTGSNITQATPVYFNHSLTPNLSIVKAVRISSNFPGLFKPINLKHNEKEINPNINFLEEIKNDKEGEIGESKINDWVKNKENYYLKNYNGWFIDGGAFNNFPINAFNSDNSPKSEFRDPKNKKELPPNNKILGFLLGGLEIEVPTLSKQFLSKKDKNDKSIIETYKAVKAMDKQVKNSGFDRSKFKFSYNDQKTNETFNKQSKIGILGLIKGLYGSSLTNSMSGRSSASYDKNNQVIKLWTGRVDLFDLVTKESELDIVDKFSYSEVFTHFGLTPQSDWVNDLMNKLRRDNMKRRFYEKKNPWLRKTERLKKGRFVRK